MPRGVPRGGAKRAKRSDAGKAHKRKSDVEVVGDVAREEQSKILGQTWRKIYFRTLIDQGCSKANRTEAQKIQASKAAKAAENELADKNKWKKRKRYNKSSKPSTFVENSETDSQSIENQSSKDEIKEIGPTAKKPRTDTDSNYNLNSKQNATIGKIIFAISDPVKRTQNKCSKSSLITKNMIR